MSLQILYQQYSMRSNRAENSAQHQVSTSGPRWLYKLLEAIRNSKLERSSRYVCENDPTKFSHHTGYQNLQLCRRIRTNTWPLSGCIIFFGRFHWILDIYIPRFAVFLPWLDSPRPLHRRYGKSVMNYKRAE